MLIMLSFPFVYPMDFDFVKVDSYLFFMIRNIIITGHQKFEKLFKN